MRTLLICLAAVLLTSPFCLAQGRKTFLAGEREVLQQGIRPARLIITTPHLGKVAVTLRVKSTHKLQSGDLQHLFQGKIRLRSTDQSGRSRWYPIAASTIVGKGVSPTLEFVAPLVGNRRSANRRGLIKVTFPWGVHQDAGSVIGKTTAVTGQRLTRKGSCPVHDVAPLPLLSSNSTPVSTDVRASADRVINIAVQADAEYSLAHGGSTEARIRATFNTVDALYQAQLGTQVHIPRVRMFVGSDQPTVSSDAFELLMQFAESNNSTQRLGLADGYVLASGKRLKDGVIGLAASRRICRGSASTYGLWEFNSDLVDVAIVAHELGHMCGAPHEDQAGINIMQSALGSVIPQSFAASSIQSISAHFGQYYSGCYGRALAEVEPTPTPTPRPTDDPTRPSPTPTPPPGPTATVPGGPGGGSGGGGPRLPPMALRAAVAKDGGVTIAAEVDDSLGLSCQLTLSAGITAGLARSQDFVIFAGAFPVTLQIGFTAKVAGSLQAKGKPIGTAGRALLYSRITCDGKPVAESEPVALNTRSINVTKGKGKKAKRVVFGGARWFGLLRSSLKQAAVTDK